MSANTHGSTDLWEHTTAQRYGGRQALIDPLTERSWTYRELNAEANKLAHALKIDDVGKDDVVMAVLVNCPEFCFSYIGPRKIGAIITLANFKLSQESCRC